jgi:sigma-E factor negative regulatory protein RseA
LKEQISALMDNDLALEDAEYLMTALKANGEASKSWATYHLIGDVMRGNKVLRHDMTASIMQEIAKQPTVLAPKPSLFKNKQVAFSVAASVAAVFFVGLVVLHQQSQEASVAPIEIAQAMPAEYLRAHQSMSPSNAAYFIQPASFSQDK